MDKKFGKQFCRNLYILAKNTFLVILHGATNANKNRFGHTKFRTCLSKLHETERSTANSSRSQAIQQGLNERFPNINILKVQVSAFFKIGITDKEENDVFQSRMKKVYSIKQIQTETWTYDQISLTKVSHLLRTLFSNSTPPSWQYLSNPFMTG